LHCQIGLLRLNNLGLRTQQIHLLIQHSRWINTHLQAGKIFRQVQRAVSRHDLETIVPVSQTNHALAFYFLQQRFANWSFSNTRNVSTIVKQEWQIKDLEFLQTELRK